MDIKAVPKPTDAAGGEAGGEASLGIEDPASLGTFGPATGPVPKPTGAAGGAGDIGALLSAASSLEQTKQCTLCKNFKPYDNFTKCSKNKSKLKAACRTCRNAKNKVYLGTARAKVHQAKRKRKATIQKAKEQGKKAKPKPGDETLDEDIKSQKYLRMPREAINDFANTEEQIRVKKASLKKAERELKMLQKAINKQKALIATLK